jgi:hypothetical protein
MLGAARGHQGCGRQRPAGAGKSFKDALSPHMYSARFLCVSLEVFSERPYCTDFETYVYWTAYYPYRV